jgi:hypothetical protein
VKGFFLKLPLGLVQQNLKQIGQKSAKFKGLGLFTKSAKSFGFGF